MKSAALLAGWTASAPAPKDLLKGTAVSDVMTKVDDAGRLDPSLYPLIVYVHVLKTAGTTVNRILGLCSSRGRDSIHLINDGSAAFVDLVRNCDWISGHNYRDRFAHSLMWLDRPIEYFSTVREPLAHLISFLNMSFRRYTEPHYYKLHDIKAQALDAEVMSVDFSNPYAVMSLLLSNADRFLNLQSRFILGADFADISDGDLGRRLAMYTYVARVIELPKLYRSFGFAELLEGVDEIRENIAKHYINSHVFDSPELRQFLAHHLQHDFRLYAAVQSASWPAEHRRPFRPAFLAAEVFTFENFDEQLYLASNPDIAADIKPGGWNSGYDHFQRWGCDEARKVRRWVFPQAAVSRQAASEAISLASATSGLRRLRDERARIIANAAMPRASRCDRA